MCRNIRTLYNFEPPATEEEVRAAALQYVRKISGFTKPSQANAEAFERAVEDGRRGLGRLLGELVDDGAAEGPRGRGGEAPGSRRNSASPPSAAVATRNIGGPGVLNRGTTMGSLTARAALLPAAALAALAGPATASAAGVQLTRIATVRQPVHVAQPPATRTGCTSSERRGAYA